MTIVIPMAGLSQRFINAGYTLPKYMLYIHNKSLFNLSVSSFEHYFNSSKFLFICRNIFDTPKFIIEECKLLRIKNYQIIILDKSTKGQAETVYIGLNKANISKNESLLIFNIDTIRQNYIFPDDIKDCDGYLEVFIGEGKNWSYAKTESDISTKVIETAEKKEISKYCSTGLYYFKSYELYNIAYNLNQSITNNELYIAPLYNNLISNNYNIRINLINREEVIFSGIPNEYKNILINRINEFNS